MKRTPTIYLILYTLVLATLTCCSANRVPPHSSSGRSSSDLKSDLFDAICGNNIAMVDSLLEQDSSLLAKIVERDNGQWTPLMYAAQLENQTMVSLLIKKGADVNKANYNDTTPLHIAAQKERLDLVKDLVQAGANVNKKNSEGNTPSSITDQHEVRGYLEAYSELGKAIKDNELQNVKHIMSNHSDISLNGKITVEKFGGGCTYLTPLQIGAAWGNYDIVKYLLDDHKDKLDIDATTEGGSTALHLAAENGHDGVARILMDNGASEHIHNKIGTPLYIAVLRKKAEVVRCLIEKGVDTTTKNINGKTALELAKEIEHTEIIDLIENYEIESKLREYVSKDSENFEHIKKIFKRARYRASSLVNGQGHSLLYHVAKKGWKGAVRFLVEKDLEKYLEKYLEEDLEEDLEKLIRQNDKRGHLSPLYIAVQEGNTEIVRLLIYGRAASNHKSSANRHEKIEQEAVEYREAAVESLRDQKGRTLLHMAAAKGHEPIVRLLVEFMAIAAEQYENSQTTTLNQNYVMRELVYVSKEDSAGETADALARDAHIAKFLKDVEDDIKKIKKNLDDKAWVASTCGVGISTGILGCISLGVLGANCNRGYQTQSWEYKRNGLIIEKRKPWRDKDKRLWLIDKSIINQCSWVQQRRCCCFYVEAPTST